MASDAIRTSGVKPRFLSTGNDAQFKERFGDAIDQLGPKHIKTTRGTWPLNAKLERVNRSIKA